MINLSTIKLNPNNPRIIKDKKFRALVKSIKEFPKMMELRPMVVDENFMVLGGNQRLKALQELGFTEISNKWVKKAKDLSAEEIKRFVIADNVQFGEHNFELLQTDWDQELLTEWGIDFPEPNKKEVNFFADEGIASKNQYGVIVMCENEEAQQNIFTDLTGKGFTCKIVVT